MPHQDKINRQKRCHILMVSPMPPAMGGISVSTSRLRDNLIADGYDVDYYNVQPYSRYLPHKLHLLLNTLWLPFYILFNRRYDIIHFHVSSYWRRIYLWLSRWMYKSAKVVHTFHGDVSDIQGKMLFNRIIRSYDAIICVRKGDSVKLPERDKCRAYEIPAFILPSDIDKLSLPDEISNFVSERTKEKLPLLVFNGLIVLSDSYYDLYGFKDFIEALKLVKKVYPELSALIIINDMTFDASRQNFVEEIKKEISGLRFVKLVVKTQFSLLPIFSKPNVMYVRPTKTDGDSLSVREALALGTRVVASDVAPRPEGTLIYENSRGFESLSEKIIEAIKSGDASVNYKGKDFYSEITKVYGIVKKK